VVAKPQPSIDREWRSQEKLQLRVKDLGSFPTIRLCPERAKICKVKALANVGGLREIECAAGNDVVDVPGGAVVLPSHPFSKLAFQMLSEDFE